MSNEFYQIPIPNDIFEKMQGKTYKENCPIPREDLRYLRVLHKDIDGRTLMKNWGGWGYSHLITRGLGLLRKAGLTWEQINQITRDNPKEFLRVRKQK